MTGPNCEEYLADSEKWEAHLAECGSCRAAESELAALDRELAASRIDGEARTSLSTVPVAPWEGASSRSWGAVIGVAFVVALLGSALFLLLGISPVDGFLEAVSSRVPAAGLAKLAQSAPGMLSQAPLGVHILIFVSFVIVNVVFVSLLRRRTKGYDVHAPR